MTQDTEPKVSEAEVQVQAKKDKRGGKRSGAGRTNVLGATVRRDLRVPLEIEKEAIRVGRGSFSEGIRMMCEEYIKMRLRDPLMEPPPPDACVLIHLPAPDRWAIVTAESRNGSTVFREAAAPQQVHEADAWRPLPEAP